MYDKEYFERRRTITETQLNLILNEIEKNTGNTKLINQISKLNSLDIIDIIKSKNNILDDLPKSIINYYKDVLLENFPEIISNCSISDFELLSDFIEVIKTDDESDLYCKYIILNSNYNSEFLNKKFPGFFTPTALLNYSRNVLKVSFIKSLKDFPYHINIGFFKSQPVSRKLIKAVNKYPNKDHVAEFYNTFNSVLENGVIYIEDDAYDLCTHPIILENIMKIYSFKGIKQYFVFKSIKKNEHLRKIFFETQNIKHEYLKYLTKTDLTHYLSFNNNCTDELLINTHKNNKDVNWFYINTNINISKYPNYIKYLLKNEDKSINIIEYNINQLHLNNKTIYNLLELLSLNILPDIINHHIKDRVKDLDAGIYASNIINKYNINLEKELKINTVKNS